MPLDDDGNEIEIEFTPEDLEAQKEWIALLQAFNNVFVGNPNGEIVLEYLKNSYYERTSLNEAGSEYKTIANEGKRFVVLDILAKIEEGMK